MQNAARYRSAAVTKGLCLIGLAIGVYFTTPTFALDFFDGWLFIWAALAIVLVVPGALGRKARSAPKNLALFLTGFAVFILVVIGTTASLFHAQAYRDLLGPVQTVGKFEAGLPPIDLSAAPLVDESMARRVAEKRLSDVPALGSSFHLGRMVKQRIGTKLYWISFLQFNSIFVQFNQGVSPGYVRVSATDVNDVELVTTLNGRPLKLFYLTSGSFGRNLERHVYFSGYVTHGIDNFLPHLDETGRPVYVVTLYHHAVGFAGADADGVLTVDAQSGEVTEYSLENAPAWIDRVQPEGFIEAQITDHGYYVPGHLFGGWLNPSDEGRLKPSGQMVLVNGTEPGRAYWYTGVTNIRANDTSISGFMLVDARTKKVRLYQLSGASEETAQKAAVGVIPEKNYSATYGLPFSIDKVPTYVMTLKDPTGIARAYAMVSIENYQVLAVADSLTATLRQYQARISGDASKLQANTGEVKLITTQGTVTRIAGDTHGGSTLYYLTVREDPTHLFVGGIDLNETLPLTQAGDSVQLSYLEGAVHVVNLKAFDNLTITQGGKQQ